MKPKTTFWRTKARTAKDKMIRIQSNNPNFDFNEAIKHISETEKFRKAHKENIITNIEADKCKVLDYKIRCSECDCWKRTKKNRLDR